MTRLPVEDRRFTPRPDLPAYELNTVCASPYKDHWGWIENHHLFRRSAHPGLKDAYWVELADGTVVPNRVGLCPHAHRMVTENRARIIYDDGIFYWVDSTGTVPLDPQPGPGFTPVDWEHNPDYVMAPDDEVPRLATNEERQRIGLPLAPAISPESRGGHKEPEPGQECRLCHRRVPHPKKPTSPQTKTFSYRVPMDDVEVHTEILEAAARHLGVYEQPHWRYWLATKSAAVVLQTAETDF